GSPFAVQGNAYQPADIAISRDSTRLYIAHSGFIQRSLLSPVTFHTLNLNTGELLDMSRTGFPSEGSGLAAISVDESGQFFVLADNGKNTLHVIRQAMPQIQPPAPVSTQTITLEPYRAFCSGVGPRLCYLATIDGQQQLFYDDIEGFTYEWGTRYELLVTVLPAANPPADGSSLRYVLDSIVSAEPVADDETFEITLPPAIIEQNDDGTYSVLGELRFVCSGLGCELLGDLLAGSDPIGFVMRFPAALGDPFDARLQVER
ncbi:MAG: DUF4377 domain-containing protein, partial [Chloroflexi bacterium]|nr:DUF4377 domain-containing protein [Chloroflexota bacterium]